MGTFSLRRASLTGRETALWREGTAVSVMVVVLPEYVFSVN